MRHLAAVPQTPGRLVAYVRVSALMGRGGDDFHSPDLQHGAIRRHTGPLGLREVALVQDIDVSGRTFSREGLDQIRTMVEAGQVDVVAVYDLSRLGRNAGEALQFIRWLRKRGVGIISTVEKIDDTPEGQFILTQFLGLAELYSNQVGRRWKEVHAHLTQLGHHRGTPLGYLRRDGRLVVDPVLGPAVTAAFRAYAAGTPISQIARTIAEVRGKRTHIDTVKRMLFKPVYVGQAVLWRVGEHRQPNVHDEPALAAPGTHEPLTDPETFKLCMERHRRDSRTPARHLNPSHSLVGLVYCGCGHHSQMCGGKLLCGIQRTTGDCPGHGAPWQADVERFVLEQVREHIRLLRGDPAARAAAVARTARAGADATGLERELGATREAMARLAAGWASGRVPDSAYERAMAPMQAAERELENRLGTAKGAAKAPPPAEIADIAEKMLSIWDDATTAERNRLMRLVVARVTIRRGTAVRQPASSRTTVELL